jgi:hypothetical protein
MLSGKQLMAPIKARGAVFPILVEAARFVRQDRQTAEGELPGLVVVDRLRDLLLPILGGVIAEEIRRREIDLCFRSRLFSPRRSGDALPIQSRAGSHRHERRK